MLGDKIEAATIRQTAITSKTRWIFVELQSVSGLKGLGEATAQGKEAEVFQAFERAVPRLAGLDPHAAIECLKGLPLHSLGDAAAASALDQACWDLIGRQADTSIAAAIDREQRLRIPVYANINRRTADRSPEGFAASARDALAAGHEAFKIAPFDEVDAEARASGRVLEAAQTGLARMRAVRETVGAHRRLMIDCHWRLDVQTSRHVIEAAAEAGLYWVECPIPEARDTLDDIAALRRFANARGVKLAGCEEMIRLDGFRPFIDAEAYDVLMPDAKYAGGLKEIQIIAAAAAERGIAVSPHNPSGPICHAASLQLCAALDGDQFLETQFDESPYFAALQRPLLPSVDMGAMVLPMAPGLGMDLTPETLQNLTVRTWRTDSKN